MKFIFYLPASPYLIFLESSTAYTYIFSRYQEKCCADAHVVAIQYIYTFITAMCTSCVYLVQCSELSPVEGGKTKKGSNYG